MGAQEKISRSGSDFETFVYSGQIKLFPMPNALLRIDLGKPFKCEDRLKAHSASRQKYGWEIDVTGIKVFMPGTYRVVFRGIPYSYAYRHPDTNQILIGGGGSIGFVVLDRLDKVTYTKRYAFYDFNFPVPNP